MKQATGPRALAKLFTADTYGALSTDQYGAPYIRELISQSGYAGGLGRKRRVRDIFDLAYAQVLRDYPCEYVFKNEIYRQRKQPVGDLVDEFWVGNTRADVVLTGETISVYEVKTDLDSFTRLDNQLASYSTVFDRVYLVTSASRAVATKVPEHVGILLLDAAGIIQEHRPAVSNKDATSVEAIHHAMRGLEVLAYCNERFGAPPLDIVNTLRQEECWRWFQTITPAEAHDAMHQALLKRRRHLVHEQVLQSAPASLKYLAATKRLNLPQLRRIIRELDEVV